MTRRVLAGAILLFSGAMLAACDAGMPNDSVDVIEKRRFQQGPPKPTEVPPGLSEDLPADTQPLTQER